TAHFKSKLTIVLHIIGLGLLIVLIDAPARSQEALSAKMIQPQKIEIEISAPFKPYNGTVDDPLISLFEIIKTGPTTRRTFERTPSNVSKTVDANNHFIATIDLPAPDKDFDHYEVEVRNYKTADE